MTLGERHNNPGNIRQSPSVIWRGQDLSDEDSDYVRFTAPEWGIRAMVRILDSYRREGIKTVRQVIERWAPPSDHNPTDVYIANVCAWCGLQPDEPLDFDAIMPQLIAAIIRQENGEQPYPADVISRGIQLAGD